MNQRMQDLEKQVTELRTALAAMQAQKSAPAEEATPASTPNPVATAATAALATPAAPATPAGPTITSLLGPTTLSGFVDVYYGVNFNHPASRATGLRNFDILTNQFGLNMIELVADKGPDATASRLGYHVALGFGQAMNLVNSSEPVTGIGFDQYLKEGYLSYLAKVGKGLQIDVGKFVTPHGAEVIETKDNWNYSRGLLFSWAIPYYHFGARAKYTFNDKYSLTGFFVNGWNNVVDNNSAKTYGMSLGWNPTKKLAVTENYMAGPEQLNDNSTWRQLTDTVVTYNPNAKLGFIMNYDYGHDRNTSNSPSTSVYWTGVAGYVRYAMANNVAVAGRYEYFNDHYGFMTGKAQHVQEFTGTLERTIASHLISRFEFRHDTSNQAVFARGGSSLDKAQNTVTGGLVLTFDTK
jgi:hypothetical protein